MTVGRGTDGLLHPPDGRAHDHHAAPAVATIDSRNLVSLPPGTTYDLDVALPRSDYRTAKTHVHGPKAAVYSSPTNSGYEGIVGDFTTSAGEAVSHGLRGAGGAKQYVGMYSKLQGAAYLSDSIFDNNVSSSALYIALREAWIVGAVLRMRFYNKFGGSATLWVLGRTVLS